MENVLIEEEINIQKNGVSNLLENGQQTPAISNQAINNTIIKPTVPNWQLSIKERLKMTIEEQDAYQKEHWEEIKERIKQLDIELSQCEWLVTDEDELDKIVSNTRREMYEQSIGR